VNIDAYRHLAWAIYLVGFLLVAGAITEPLVQMVPLQPADVMWRFGAVGLLTGALVGFVFGLAWLTGAAMLFGHHGAQRGLAVLSLATSLLLVIVAGLYLLDFTQVRDTVNPVVRRNVDLTLLRGLVILGAAIPALVALGVAGWRGGRGGGRARGYRSSDDRPRGQEPKPLIYLREP
jgi:hypothetical protein